MSRRLVYLVVGLAAGLLAVRQAALAVQAAELAQAADPTGPGEAAGPTGPGTAAPVAVAPLDPHHEPAPGGNLGERLSAFLGEVRALAAEREAELRTTLGLDGTHDAVDAHL